MMNQSHKTMAEPSPEKRKIEERLAALRTGLDLYYDFDVLGYVRVLKVGGLANFDGSEGGALWAVLDQDRYYSRCGCSQDLLKTIRNLELAEGEKYVVIFTRTTYQRTFRYGYGKRIKQMIRNCVSNSGYWAHWGRRKFPGFGYHRLVDLR